MRKLQHIKSQYRLTGLSAKSTNSSKFASSRTRRIPFPGIQRLNETSSRIYSIKMLHTVYSFYAYLLQIYYGKQQILDLTIFTLVVKVSICGDFLFSSKRQLTSRLWNPVDWLVRNCFKSFKITIAPKLLVGKRIRKDPSSFRSQIRYQQFIC